MVPAAASFGDQPGTRLDAHRRGSMDSTEQNILEGLRVIRDGLRVGLRLMPSTCDESVSFRPLLRDLELQLAMREPEMPRDLREPAR